jgi:hypothetical protein
MEEARRQIEIMICSAAIKQNVEIPAPLVHAAFPGEGQYHAYDALNGMIGQSSATQWAVRHLWENNYMVTIFDREEPATTH